MANKNWCFTINNYTQLNKDFLISLEQDADIQYLGFQAEQGESGTPHLQGFIQLKARRSLRMVQRLLGCPTAHMEAMRGTAQQAAEYCLKSDGFLEGPWVFGQLVGKGKRNDIDSFVTAAAEEIVTEGKLISDFPHVLARYPEFCRRILDYYAEQRVVLPDFVPRPGWQLQLWNNLRGPVPPRKISWFTDEVGGSGKSLFANGYRNLDGSRGFVFDGGRYADVAYAYDRQRVVFIDLTREYEEKVPYKLMESLKNGRIFSPKYASRSKVFLAPHVIVFANFYPDKEKLSADRWDIHNIKNPF